MLIKLYCEICGQELDEGHEHHNLAYCVAALVEYVKGSEQTFSEELARIRDEVWTAQRTADEAMNAAQSASDRVERLEDED